MTDTTLPSESRVFPSTHDIADTWKFIFSYEETGCPDKQVNKPVMYWKRSAKKQEGGWVLELLARNSSFKQ